MTLQNNPLPANEAERLETLRQYHVMDTIPEKQFDDITKLASIICGTPITLISLIDEKRQWFKSRIGLDVQETPRSISFCQHAILHNEIFEVENSLEDERFVNNPLVTGFPNIRFYAGAPLKTSAGYNMGTLCVIDTKPNKLNEQQKEALAILANEVVANMELRRDRNKIEGEKQSISDSNDLLNAFFENSPAFITMKDSNEKYIYANSNALRIFGKDAADVIGRPSKDFLPADIAELIRKDDQEIIETRKSIRKEYQTGTGDETIHYVSHMFPLLNSKNEVYGVGTISNDVTESKKIEIQLTEAKKEAEQATMSKSLFLANMSHEIRTPLNAMLGFADLMESTPLTAKQKDYLEAIETSGKNLLTIINDILDFSKIEAGMLSIESVPFGPQQLIHSAYTMFFARAQSKNLKLFISIDPKLPALVSGDPTRLNQILVNLMGNAIKFTNEGSVSLDCEVITKSPEKVKLKISVKDTGIGISPEKLSSIFDRFTQAESDTTRNFGGTGLGLSIAKKLVELQGGEILVKSTIGAGSEFFFTIDYTIADEKEYTTDKVTHYKNDEAFNNKKILIVEDNNLNQKLASTLLNNAGIETEIAENGQIAVDKLQKKSYDLILMDIQMPVLDGYQATKKIRRELNISTPIIAMTANAMAGEQERCIDAGMDEYLTKPFKSESLLNMVYTFLNKSNKHPETIHTDKENIANRVTNLTYLKEFSGGKSDFIKEMLGIFLDQNPKDLSALEEATNSDNFERIKAIAHSLQTSLGFIGISENHIAFLRHAESMAATEKEHQTIKSNIKTIIEVCRQAQAELRVELNQLR